MSQAAEPHLPATTTKPMFYGLAGRLLLRPWFDWVTLRWVTGVYFPLSRGWAAARWADGDLDAFTKRIGLSDPPNRAMRRLVAALPLAEVRYRRACSAWTAAFHADIAPDAETLVTTEVAREAAAQHLMAQRFQGMDLRRRFPAVEFHVADPTTVEAAHGARLSGPEEAFPPPSAPAVRRSHRVAGPYGRVSWIDWPAPTLGDRASGRVIEPDGRSHPPTFIHLHGIGMELEMWKQQDDPVNAMAQRHGIRVVRPEGPWHGSRMVSGFWGGEPALAFAPKGYLDLIRAWVAELAQLVAWARATSAGPVAVGGLSLGALCAQIAASAAQHWPAAMRPDALFLCMTSGDMLDVAFEGQMAKRLGALDAVRAAGWSHEKIARYRPLLEPQGELAMPPEAIVMHLGRFDDVTPYRGGRDLARRWNVPKENLFLRARGHFSAPLALGLDTAPLDRLAAILEAA